MKIVYQDRFFEAKMMEKYFHLYFKHKIEKTFWNENCLFILRAQSIQFRTYLKDAKLLRDRKLFIETGFLKQRWWKNISTYILNIKSKRPFETKTAYSFWERNLFSSEHIWKMQNLSQKCQFARKKKKMIWKRCLFLDCKVGINKVWPDVGISISIWLPTYVKLEDAF